MTPLRAWMEWLAEDAGCPVEVCDSAEFEAEAMEILGRIGL